MPASLALQERTMPRIIEGGLVADGLKFAIAVSRFNDFITSKLVDGALDTIARHGGQTDDVAIVKVPGSYELPLTCKKLAAGGDYNAVIALGAVIRGGTPHYDYIANEAAKGVAQASLDTGVPIVFGVITAETLEQAIERAGTKQGNAGSKAAAGAIEMAGVMKQL
jgi:6,7-dimethyl-8-ribityllumazine synthase